MMPRLQAQERLSLISDTGVNEGYRMKRGQRRAHIDRLQRLISRRRDARAGELQAMGIRVVRGGGLNG